MYKPVTKDGDVVRQSKTITESQSYAASTKQL